MYVPGQVRVTFKSFVNPKTRRAMIQERGGLVIAWDTENDSILLEVPEGTETDTVEYFNRAPGVVLANQVLREVHS